MDSQTATPTNVTNSPDELLNKDIFELLGLKDVSDKERSAIIADMSETIQNRILARILDSLSAEKVTQFQQLLDGAEQKAIDDFLITEKLDIQKIATETTIMYKVQLLAAFKADETVKTAAGR